MKRIGMIFLALLMAVTFLAAGCAEPEPAPEPPAPTPTPAPVTPTSDDPVRDMMRGGVAVECGHYDIAIELLDLAINTPGGLTDRQMAMAYNYRGLANTWLGNCDAAIADYSRAIELFPAYDAAYYNRGFTYAKCGDLAAARADMGKAQSMGYYPQNKGRRWCPAF